ncbi:MAG: Hsp70 family protein [Planctomycetia bacterium]|nr:Hsp70 family protein [Planctomycetia bacterium]
MPPKYVVGIDLGTTNSVLAYASLSEEKPNIELLDVPQLVAAGTTEVRTALPSFLYLCPENEPLSPIQGLGEDFTGSRTDRVVVGEFARRRSAEVPDRIVSGAKSWLCHSRVDRRAPILPWDAGKDVAKISPVATCRIYLEYLCEVWKSRFPNDPIVQQQVVITVPASFDASARELTREAALAAGFSPETLLFLEEPQAAIYSWLADHDQTWRKEMSVGETLLVCDVGGGTSDFSLVRAEEENGDLILNRLAVGNHLLVGGDNMDLALAYRASELFADIGTKLNPWQTVSLWHSCRQAKENLLGQVGNSANNEESFRLSVLGRSSRLIGGTVSVDFSRTEALDLGLNGFFPICDFEERPKRKSAIGFRELGLPFEQETAITRHLATFLKTHGVQRESGPTRFLLNGGVFKSSAIRSRLEEQLGQWFPNQAPKNLDASGDLDHAVARGAAFYAWGTLRGGVRIHGASARAYYVGIESAGLAIPGRSRPLKALCVAPMGMEEGSSCDVPSDEIGLAIGEPALFRFFSSTCRPDDKPGTLLDQSCINDGVSEGTTLEETDSIETALSADDSESEEEYVPVCFRSNITELGQLEIWCCDTQSDRRWKLEFSVRDE